MNNTILLWDGEREEKVHRGVVKGLRLNEQNKSAQSICKLFLLLSLGLVCLRPSICV